MEINTAEITISVDWHGTKAKKTVRIGWWHKDTADVILADVIDAIGGIE